jgi:NAD(P)-dependent dehydrogenase (short-subunit alcohol dehydrogenase family)
MVDDQSRLQAPIGHNRALVTGGTGALGPGLVRHLADAGFAVRVVARRLLRQVLFRKVLSYLWGTLANGNACGKQSRE